MQKGKIVIVEGTSCVGKTTLCDSLKRSEERRVGKECRG